MNEQKMNSSSNRDILQAYRMANEIARNSKNPDEEIAAYNEVVNLGLNNREKPDMKLNTVMYWAYNNMGDALLNKSVDNNFHAVDVRTFDASIESYLNSLHFAKDNLEKISVFNRIAENYKYLGDEFKWCEYKEKMIANMRPEEKRKAYCDLASEIKNKDLAIEIYEEALQHVNSEEVSLYAKCQNTLQICEAFLLLYREKGDYANVARIEELMVKTAALGVKVLEERQDNENDEEKKLESFAKQIEFENKYLHPDGLRQKCMLRRLREMLNGREIVIDGETYSDEMIRKKLKDQA